MRLVKPSYKTMTDESLMIAVAKGDKRAFDEVYARYSGPLIGYFMRMLWRDREKAEDFMHDIFAKLVRRPELFDPTRKFKTWVYSVANNMCKNEYKRAEVRKNTSNGLDSSYAVSDTNTNVFHEVADRQFKGEFDRCLADLDDKHSEAFKMRHMDGLSIKEIAEILDISDGTVKSRIFYASKYLAKSLKEYNPVLNR
ncbi:MAG: RNA polymerase sigma factor [Crocinitomicaceae bacterium]|nr:RNA polymerase sigma factor [Crocinitomicaceae bacterium]